MLSKGIKYTYSVMKSAMVIKSIFSHKELYLFIIKKKNEILVFTSLFLLTYAWLHVYSNEV